MRQYNEKSLGFIFSLDGSVFPHAFRYAFPNSILAVFLWYYFAQTREQIIVEMEDVTVSQVWVGYNWVVGFLVSFRVAKAYARWWEGGTLLQQARGEWFNAYSSLIAFCSDKAEKHNDVVEFQQLLARLVSMLYAAALQTVSMSEDSDFELIGYEGIDEDALIYLLHQPDKCELLLQWIQRLIVDNVNIGVLPIAPPILSRAFQELSRGIVNIHNVRKITEFQFPFPFAQFITTMLLLQWLVTPFFAALQVGSPLWAGLLSYVTVFAMWGTNRIAVEIEQPFGDDTNDLPMKGMQVSMNSSILSLLRPRAKSPPKFDIYTDYEPDKKAAPPTIAGMCAHMETLRNSKVKGSGNRLQSSFKSQSYMGGLNSDKSEPTLKTIIKKLTKGSSADSLNESSLLTGKLAQSARRGSEDISQTGSSPYVSLTQTGPLPDEITQSGSLPYVSLTMSPRREPSLRGDDNAIAAKSLGHSVDPTIHVEIITKIDRTGEVASIPEVPDENGSPPRKLHTGEDRGCSTPDSHEVIPEEQQPFQEAVFYQAIPRVAHPNRANDMNREQERKRQSQARQQ